MSPTVAGSCRTSDLRWFGPGDIHHRGRLDSWCAGVGQAVLRAGALETTTTAGTPSVNLEDVTFVSWNVHVGNGDINAFVGDLRAGVFTGGTPVRHFVLMLQEVVRSGDVPAFADGASGARRIAAHASRSIDIIDISRDLGLSLIYVPSMRNGDSTWEPAADRGSANRVDAAAVRSQSCRAAR